MGSIGARVSAVFAVGIALAVLTGCGSSREEIQPSTSQSAEQADHNADDVMFARLMVSHHEQGVEMAQMVPTNTTNQQVIDFATQIITTHVQKTQVFRAWLMQREDTQGHEASHSGMPTTGMVDEATMAKLRALTGDDFDRLWLTSMIEHHRGAIAMAQSEIAYGKNPDVIYLAKSNVSTQQAEIDQMTQMLRG